MGAVTKNRARNAKPADGPARLCAVLRAQRSPDDLIRFALSPDGDIVPDLACRLPGRGVWITANRAIVEKAAKSRAFQRSLKQPVRQPDDLAGLVDTLLARRAIESLSLANKAGLVVAGFAKVEATLNRGTAIALIHAADAAEDGTGKLDRKFHAIMAERGLPARNCQSLTIEELSLAMGRSNVVHAALTRGGAAEKFLSQAGRLQRYRSEFVETPAEFAPPATGLSTETA